MHANDTCAVQHWTPFGIEMCHQIHTDLFTFPSNGELEFPNLGSLLLEFQLGKCLSLLKVCLAPTPHLKIV